MNRGAETGGYMQRLRRRYLFEWMLMLLLLLLLLLMLVLLWKVR